MRNRCDLLGLTKSVSDPARLSTSQKSIHNKLARATLWGLTGDGHDGLSHVSTPILTAFFSFWISLRNGEDHGAHLVQLGLRKVHWFGWYQSEAGSVTGLCASHSNLLSEPGFLVQKAPCSLCHLENWVISVVSWENRNAGLSIFCVVFKCFMFVRGHVNLCRVW